MATITKKTNKNFLIGDFVIWAVTEFRIDFKYDLVEYDSITALGRDYENFGEGEVSISVRGIMDDFINLGNSYVAEFKGIESYFRTNTRPVRFNHPDLFAIDVQVAQISMDENGEKTGINFTMDLKKVTKSESVRPTQRNKEAEFDAIQIDSDREYTVTQGQSLWGIAQAELGEGLWWRKLYDYNRERNRIVSQDPATLAAGEKILIPII